MNYKQIEDLLFCLETNDLVLDGDYYTDPFFAKDNDRVGDMFFFYSLDKNEALIYAYVIIDPKTKSIIKHRESVTKSVCLTDSHKNEDNYKNLYEQVHEFVFNKDLTIAQLELLKSYYEILHTLDYRFAFEIYNLFMPEFLNWAKWQISL